MVKFKLQCHPKRKQQEQQTPPTQDSPGSKVEEFKIFLQ
jgi:hypothetical protein